MYNVYHPDYVNQPWQTYVAYLLILWLCAALVIFANRAIPYTQNAGMFFVIIGGIVTIIVISAMPKQHATNADVWGSFDVNNLTGWGGGVAFLCGVLNGAFTIGTPDAITHMAEELPHPKKDLPKAIGLQLGLGFLCKLNPRNSLVALDCSSTQGWKVDSWLTVVFQDAFCFAIALCYAITDLSALQGGFNTYPLANIYLQATSDSDGNPNNGATFGLLFIIWVSSLMCCIGTVLTNSRIYWALARDNAVPFSGLFGQVTESLSCPIPATLFVGTCENPILGRQTLWAANPL